MDVAMLADAECWNNGYDAHVYVNTAVKFSYILEQTDLSYKIYLQPPFARQKLRSRFKN
jgi:hypothetical protein